MEWYNAINERNNFIKEKMIEQENEQHFTRHNRGSSVDMNGGNYYSANNYDEDGDVEAEDDADTSYYYDPETGEYYQVEGGEVVYPIVDEADELKH
jgi:hypothetical protein